MSYSTVHFHMRDFFKIFNHCTKLQNFAVTSLLFYFQSICSFSFFSKMTLLKSSSQKVYFRSFIPLFVCQNCIMNHTMLKDNWRKCHFSILCQLGFWFFCCANCRIFAWFSPSLCVSCLLHSSVRFWLHSRRISMQKSSQSTVVKKCTERSHFGTILT